MDQYAFTNRVRSLYNIDKHVLDKALVEAGLEPLDDHYWMAFRENPPRFFIKTDKPTADAIWKAVEARQRKEPNRVAVLEDLLDRCAEFIDGYVDVVDGDYGEPEPNKAMRLMAEIREEVPASPTPAA